MTFHPLVEKNFSIQENRVLHIEDHYFGPVITDSTDIYWLGADRGTNNTGELSGFATALLHLQADGGHETAAICYDSKYAANTTDGTWNAKSNLEAVRTCRDLYEAEHERRNGGVILVHVKGHSGDIGNDQADTNVQSGKGPPPYSRLQLSHSETAHERTLRHSVLCELDFPGFVTALST